MINPYSLRNMREEVPDLASLYSNTPMSMDPSSAFSSSMPQLKPGGVSLSSPSVEVYPQVTGAPVASTGGVAESPWSPRWIDMPWGISGNTGNTQLPTINVSDILFRPEETVRRNADFETGGWDETLPNRWEWASPEVMSRYSWFGTPRSDSVMFMPGEDPNSFYAQIKSADKQGTRVKYVRQGNEYVPVPETSATVGWDTNTGFSDIAPALILAAPALASIAFPGLFGGLAGGAAEGALAAGDFFGGLSAEAAGAFGTGAGSVADLFGTGALGSAAAGLPAELGGVGGIVSGSTSAPSLVEGLGTGFAGTGAMTGTLPSIVPEVAAGGLGLSGLLEGVGGAIDTVGDIADVVGGVNRILNPNQGGGNQGGGRRATGLPGLLSGLYGNYANRQLAGALRDIAGNMQQVADPYLQKLRESYENPNAYLNSPEMQAVLGLEANKLAGIDAAQGRLSNDINRTALLQKLAQSRLGDYRSGLQQAVRSVYKPEAFVPMLQKAAEEDAARYADLVGWVGSGGNIGDVWEDIGDIIDTGEDIWDVISGWWD